MGPRLDAAAVGRAVRGSGIDVPAVWFSEIGSTNAEARVLAAGGAPEWTVLATGHQTAGRGRLGRTWEDRPGGSLLFSLILRPNADPARAPLLNLLTAVEMIAACGAPAMRSKWPNDLVIGDRKVGGILAEAELAGGRLAHVVVGVGLNIGASGEDPPAPGATTLALEGSSGADPEAILRRFLGGMRAALVTDPGLSSVTRRYARVCATLGSDVTADVAGERRLSGRAVDVDEEGRLVVENDDGRSAVSSGEVTMVRGAAG